MIPQSASLVVRTNRIVSANDTSASRCETRETCGTPTRFHGVCDPWLRATIPLIRGPSPPASTCAGGPPTTETPRMAVEPLIFELSSPGRRAVRIPAADVPETPLPDDLRRDALNWPEVSEIDVIRHFTRVSQKN